MPTTFDEKGKIFTEVIKKRPVDVHIQMSNHLIKGKFHVRLHERIKDELDKSNTFIALTDAGIYDLKSRLIYNCSFLTVNRQDIVWLFQDDDLKNDGEDS
ncbi:MULTISPECIES: DUF6812 domain-containing protein [Desulfobacula]|uniref:Uncharacterized protein n=2 Tax=Desulfobacula TaxID=28222 RepID=K0NBD2_DESTT|nr:MULTISPECIES: hypothetical protein [Desulfobacula]CCK81599.1 uncharacterized protein TOL2_C34420 [Desulfobacula toluolica Tol2]SDU32565.1 hypothetical protein SAMN04487931_106312 [Desulfobacula phenolica]